ncbi:MoaD/ThiS family protein [Thermogladius sp. 4427co]|uniref:MoaD/ThiS family protein n=1 Tax=Thermogladius sp. 4427co TaxID=3450718 RepID=UPI003F7AAE0F
MRIYIRAYGLLSDYIKEGYYVFEDEKSVNEILKSLIPEGVLEKYTITVLVNDKIVGLEDRVRDGDILILLPPSSGGV